MVYRRRASDRPAEASDNPGPERARTVLVVDDEASVREFVERALTFAGYRTEVAADGPEALEVFARHGAFDLLVTDLRMPQMMGDELARQLRLAYPTLKVLYLTGYSDELFRERNTLWSDEAFLDKPQGVDALLEAVSLLLFGNTHAAKL
jgi:two-component system, cell cycle sensor histidine kinase and response regulator CckA